MDIALATCAAPPGTERDDDALHQAFQGRGARVFQPVWNDPAVDWSAFDACLIRTTWDYTDHLEQFVAWARSTGEQTHLFNPAKLVQWNAHKSYLRALEQEGIALAPTVWLSAGTQEDLASLLRRRGWTRALVKPLVGACAQGTMRVEADSGDVSVAQEHLDQLLVVQDVMVQAYVPSVETEGELSAIFLGGAFSHGVRKVPARGDYRVMDLFGATDALEELSTEEVAVARDVLRRACVLTGESVPVFARIDFLRDEAGALLLNEVELIEPFLFFRHCPQAAERMADVTLARLADLSSA